MTRTTFKRDDDNARLTIEREFAAPRDRVWIAMTDPQILDQWWAPQPWKTQTLHMDFRVGGYWHYAMNGPDGERHFGRMDYLEIEPGKRYKSKDAFVDAAGTVNAALPTQTMDVRLIEQAGRTRVITVVEYASAEDLQKIIDMGMREGLSMAHDQLEKILESQR